MKLENKKNLVVRTIGVGKARIAFNQNRLSEIKESITKQDIRDLVSSGAIIIKEIKGTKTKVKRKLRRRAGSIKKRVIDTKRIYINRTRKLRAYIKKLYRQDMLSNEIYRKLRQEIRASMFRDLAHLRERIEVLKHA